MSATFLIRWSGIAVILAGIFTPLATIMDIPPGLGFVAAILFIYGIIGIYACQYEKSGFWGFFGFILVILSNCIYLGQAWLPGCSQFEGVAGVLGSIVGITGLPGFLLLSIGAWQANKLPRWMPTVWFLGYAISYISVLIANSGVQGVEPFINIGITIWGIGFIGAGFKLWNCSFEQ